MPGRALVPRLAWLPGYGAEAAAKDAIAGLVLSILLVPQAMAYAQLAGLPPEMGLFAALLPPVLYALFGTSSFVSLGPVALVSLVVAEAAGNSGGDPATAAVLIAIEAGVLLMLLGGLGLGRLVNFISEPVLLGFTAAAAFLIAASQLPTLLGIEAARSGNLVGALSTLLGSIEQTSWPTLWVGAGALAALLLANRLAAPLLWKLGVRPPFRQAIAKAVPLAVIVAAGFAATLWPGAVATVRAIDAALPSLPGGLGAPRLWLDLLPSAVAVAIIVFVTATAVAKSLAGSDRSQLDTSREAVALGSANIAAALTGGYAVGASLSRSALVEDSGARSPLASVVGALVVLAVLLLLAPLLAFLPETALAALVISAVFGLIKWRDIKDVWRHDRIEGAIIALSFLGTLLLGVRWGLALGAGLGIAHFLWFSSLPRVTRVGTDDGGVTFRSIDREAVQLETLPTLVVRIDRSLYFGNAAYCEEEILDRLSEHETIEKLILDMRAVNDVDASGAAMLRRLTVRLREMGVEVHFAEIHAPVRARMNGLDSKACTFHRSVRQAVEHCGVLLDDTLPYT
ncbi:SulP family inorganic anion transporter [Qipengyuania sp. MTN3-11]|uniref:SulP family inorganic anion transporter n=1 Tax=Qipengyuania sp. MTN3-11 TaxID=3056557 RepID=UPI0036F238CD